MKITSTFIICMCFFFCAKAQTSSEEFLQPVKERRFDRAGWNETTRGINYNQPGEKEKKFDENNYKRATKGLHYGDQEENYRKTKTPVAYTRSKPLMEGTPALKWILFIGLIALLAFVLYKLIGKDIFLRNPKIVEKGFSIDNLDEHIHESDLERFLREALEQKNYRLAVRISYLIIIKELSERKLIKWRKEKTNYEYLGEMSRQSHFANFRELTLVFERTWYGDYEIREPDFLQVHPKFQQYVFVIRKDPQS